MATPKLLLAADAIGFGLGIVTAVTRRVPGASTIATVLGAVETNPGLRRMATRLVPVPAADVLLNMGTAVSSGMAGGIAGPLTDAALRLAQRSSELAQRALHEANPSEQSPSEQSPDEQSPDEQSPSEQSKDEPYAGESGTGEPNVGQAAPAPQRPVRLPPGPIERYTQLSATAGTAAAAAGLLLGRSSLGADSPAVAMLQASLPRAATAGRDMFVARLGSLLASRGVAVDEPQALAVLDRVDTVLLDPSVTTADRVGLPELTAATARTSATITEARQGDRLADTVGQLQADGRTVMVVSTDPAALASADVAVCAGHEPARRIPTVRAGVHVHGDLAVAATVVDAIDVASAVSRRSVTLAEAGSAIAAIAAFNGKAGTAVASARMAGSAAMAAAIAQAAVLASDLAHGPATGTGGQQHQWHQLDCDKVMVLLATGPEGLSTAQAEARAAGSGQQTSQQTGQPATGHGLISAFVQELRNPLTPVLGAGAAVSAAIGSVADAAIVLATGGLGAALGAVQRRVTDRSLADLLAASAVVATVRRDGTLVTVPADRLVDGDVIELRPGDVVPADARLHDCVAFELDESSLTGESLPVAKQTEPVAAQAIAERTCMVYQGTTVAAGRGTAVVVATGSRTVAMAAVGATPPNRGGGVAARLAEITATTVPVAAGSIAAVLLSGLVRGRPLRKTISGAVGLAVASVPEGLPFLVNAAQLAAARRLSAMGALVRDIATVEALGRVDVLCFDKTGTLTKGAITLDTVSDGRTAVTVDRELPQGHRTVLAAGLRATPVRARPSQLAHNTDRAVAEGAERASVSRELDAPGWTPVDVLPFEPSRGYHAVAAETDLGRMMTVKGAPEIVLPRCRQRRDGEGLRDLRQRDLRRLREEVRRLARSGYRVLAVAESVADPGDAPFDGQSLAESDTEVLTFVGLLAFADPVRRTAGASIEELSGAGAQIVVLTGDHPDTAERIADELGIGAGHTVVTGAQIDELDDDQLAELVPKISVVARSTPADKVRVVRAFQQAGRVVAMTGDGANDAPAIRLADVGIAMGSRGTPAAAAAADLIVTDDRLETIIAALVEGRAMWRSVRQGLSVLVGGNLGEIGFTVFGSALTGLSPLSARQLLLVNLLTDLAPAMVLAVRRPKIAAEALLSEGPESSLGAALNREIAARAVTTAVGAGTGWLVARCTGSRRRAATVALISLVGTQLAQTAVLGRSSPAVLVACSASALALGIAVQTPGVSGFFGCTPIGPVGWGIATSAAVGAMVATAITGLPAGTSG